MTTTQHSTARTRERNGVLHVSISNSVEDGLAAAVPPEATPGAIMGKNRHWPCRRS